MCIAQLQLTAFLTYFRKVYVRPRSGSGYKGSKLLTRPAWMEKGI